MSALRRADPRTGRIGYIDEGPYRGGVKPGSTLAGYRITGYTTEEAQRWAARDARIRREREGAGFAFLFEDEEACE